MKNKKRSKPQSESSNIEDPAMDYGTETRSGGFQVFHSFEESDLANSVFIAQQNPVERLRNTVELIIRAFGFTRKTLNERKPKNKITILRNE